MELAREAQLRRLQEDFVARLTEELRSLLSVIRIALGDEDGKVAPRERLLVDMNTLIGVVESSAAVARLDQNHAPILKADVELGALLDRLTRDIPMHGRVRVVSSAFENWVHTDPRVLRLILGALIYHGLRNAPPDTEVVLSIGRAVLDDQPAVRVSVVVDIGPDGPPDATRIFDSFEDLGSLEDGMGGGLGLFLARTLARRVGGEVDCSVLPRWLTFRFLLPS